MADPTPADEAKKPGGKFKFILIPLALLSLGAGGAVGFSQYGLVTRALALTGAESADEDAPKADDAEAKKPVEYGSFYQFEGITVNTAGSGGSHYLMMNIGVEAADEGTIEELKSREIVVRDTVLKILSLRTFEELALVEMRTQLKDEVRGAFNSILSEGQIDRVYFTQYVLQ